MRTNRYRSFTGRFIGALVATSAASSLACTISPANGGADAGDGEIETDDAGTPPKYWDAAPPPSSSPPPAHLPSPVLDAGTTPVDAAPAAAVLMYLISDSNEMYSFDPGALKIVDLGSLVCPGEPWPPNSSTGSGAANSMALDRNGTAWVNFQDGRIFQVNTASLSCTSTSFQPGQAGFSWDLGMAFVHGGASGSAETLYVSDNADQGGASKGLAWIDLTTMTLHPIGSYSGAGAGFNAELTGIAGGRLYGFFATSPSTLAEINPQNASVYNVNYLDAVNSGSGSPACDPNAWVYMGNDDNACNGLIGESCGWTTCNQGQGYHCAVTSWGTGCEPGGATCPNGTGSHGFTVSFWGGNFWLFTAASSASDPNSTTSITKYDTTADQTYVVMSDIGANIVGAGVSSQQ